MTPTHHRPACGLSRWTHCGRRCHRPDRGHGTAVLRAQDRRRTAYRRHHPARANCPHRALTSLDKELVIPLDDGNYHLTVHVDGTGVWRSDLTVRGRTASTHRLSPAGQCPIVKHRWAQVVIFSGKRLSGVDAVLG